MKELLLFMQMLAFVLPQKHRVSTNKRFYLRLLRFPVMERSSYRWNLRAAESNR